MSLRQLAIILSVTLVQAGHKCFAYGWHTLALKSQQFFLALKLLRYLTFAVLIIHHYAHEVCGTAAVGIGFVLGYGADGGGVSGESGFGLSEVDYLALGVDFVEFAVDLDP